MPESTSPLTEAVEPKSPEPGFWQKNKTAVLIAIGLLLAVVVVVVLLSVAMAHPQGTATFRDFMIITMAAMSCLIGLALLVLIYQIAMLTSLLRDEIKPLLESANETMNTLRGTTVFMSQNLVEPAIQASSAFAGAQRILQVLLGLRPGRSSKS